MSRRLLLGLVAATLLATSGCRFDGVLSLPLPGGPGGDKYTVTVLLPDALDLVPHDSVRVGDVVVGEVESVDLRGWTAAARCRVKRSVHLPANAVATLSQTSLLGEKFVQLSAPPGSAATGRLRDGAVIPLSRTTVDVSVEEVLSAMASLLNGGGLDQIRTIAEETNKILSGREQDARDLLVQLKTFVGGLDAQKSQLVRAIDATDRLAAKLAGQKQAIATTLDRLGPGLKVLADQHAQLTAMLQAMSHLGAVGAHVVEASRESTLADLRKLQPVAEALAKSASDLPKFLPTLLTYPLGDAALQAVNGAYGNMTSMVQLDVAELLQDLVVPEAQGLVPTTPQQHGGPLPALPVPSGTPSAPTAPSPSPSASSGGVLRQLLGGGA